MKNMKQLVFLLSMLFAICIFYNLCKSDDTNKALKEYFKEFSPLTQEDLLQNLEIKPHNEFQKMKTPVGNKALVQYSDNNDDTYYKFSKNINPGHNYKISSWESTTNDWNGKDKLLNIKMYDKSNKIHALSSNGTIKKTMEVAGINWNYIEYNFIIPDGFKNIIDIFLGYKPQNTKGKRYVADLKLKEFITDVVDFPNINKLVLYLDASLPKSYTNESAYKKYWINVVNDKTKFRFEKEPKWNNRGYFNMVNRKIIGPSPKQLKLNNNEFSIILVTSSLGEIDTTNPVALKIFGNQNVAFAISIPNSQGNIIIDVADKKYMIKQSILAENKNIFTITYKSNTLKLYLDEALVETINNIPNIHFNNDNIEINPYYKWNANLYSILFYNKELTKQEVRFLTSHFKKTIIDNESSNFTPSTETFKNDQEDLSFNQFLSTFNSQKIKCPTVNFENNKYSFNVTNTEYGKSAGIHGNKYYDNKSQCMKDYNSLFKDCNTPPVLKNKTKSAENCIFTGVHTTNPLEHPCQACPELDNYDYKRNVNLNPMCKSSIISYCNNQLLKDDIDKNCICFTDEYSKTPDCQKYLLELHNNTLDYDSIQN
tara:strand:+ start:257 stop:2047 length:1791 start_codon:yes stop_codon:yes gene_type:complete